MIRLDPLVLGFDADPRNPNVYTVNVKTELLGIPSSSRYTLKFIMVVDGFDVAWRSGFGTIFAASWRAKWVEGKTEITEKTTAKAFFLRLPFIMTNLRKSHEQLLNALASKLEGQDPTPSANP